MSAALVPPTLLRLAGAGAVVQHSVVSSRRTTIVQGCKGAAWTNKRKRDDARGERRGWHESLRESNRGHAVSVAGAPQTMVTPLASQARLHCPLTPQAMMASMQLLPKALQ